MVVKQSQLMMDYDTNKKVQFDGYAEILQVSFVICRQSFMFEGHVQICTSAYNCFNKLVFNKKVFLQSYDVTPVFQRSLESQKEIL